MSQRPPPHETIAERFRREIERAASDGLDRGDMMLRLTLNDADRLRRDRSVPVADISFSGANMRYLGVLVQTGGIAQSALELREPG